MKFLSNTNKGELYAIVSGIAYGFVGYFGIQIMNDGHNIGTMVFWRFLAAALITGVILKIKGQKTVFYSKAIFLIFLSGLIFYGPSSIMYFYSSKYIGTGLAMVIFFIYPALVVIINKVLYKIDISPIYYVSIATILSGMVLLVDLGDTKFNILGILLGVLSAWGYAGYVALCKIVHQVDPLASTLVVSLGCAFSGIIFSLIEDNSFSMPYVFSTWVGIMALALISTILPILLFLQSIQYISSTKASILSVLEPIFVVIVGVILLHEQINLIQVVGVITVLVGALIALMCKKD